MSEVVCASANRRRYSSLKYVQPMSRKSAGDLEQKDRSSLSKNVVQIFFSCYFRQESNCTPTYCYLHFPLTFLRHMFVSFLPKEFKGKLDTLYFSIRKYVQLKVILTPAHKGIYNKQSIFLLNINNCSQVE